MTTGRRYRGSNKVAPQPPPPAPSFPESPSFFSTMTQGMALGAGSSIGHRAVDTLFGSSHKNVGIETQIHKKPHIVPECQTDYDLLLECIKSKDNDHCSTFHEAFVKCNQN
jgi:hypothetical protein